MAPKRPAEGERRRSLSSREPPPSAAEAGPHRLAGSIPNAFSSGRAPADDRVGHAVLVRCAAAGVHLFDSGPSGSAARAEEFVSAAFPGPTDFSLEVSSTLSAEPFSPESRRGRGGLGAEPSSESRGPLGPIPKDWPGEIRAAIERSRRRLDGRTPSLVWLEADAVPALEAADVRRALEETTAAAEPGEAWGVRFESAPPDPQTLSKLLGLGVRSYAFPVHLLNSAASVPIAQAIGERRGRVLALDVHAGGRLNGQRLLGPLGSTPPGPLRPMDLASLRKELLPVTQLGFLTRDRSRTLAQAAIQFVLGLPDVLAAVVPISDPSRLEEWTHAEARPPLTRSDREEVLRLSREGPR